MPENQANFLVKNVRPLIVFAIVGACLIIYSQTIYFDFINIDDRAYIYENRAVLSGLNGRSINWAFTQFYSANWHPLTWLSHMLDVMLFGLNAGGHHAVNVVFHTINSILAFVVFRRMTGALWKSAIVALLFAVHPAHVESVAWIAERKDVLSTMFWLLTMLAYIEYAKFRRAKSNGKPIAGETTETDAKTAEFGGEKFYYVLTIVLFALGLMSKPMLVTLPFVLLLCDFWNLERLKFARDLPPLIVEKIPLFALVVVSSVITFLAQQSSGAAVSLETLPLGARLANVSLAYAKYVVMLFYPVNLGFWYPFEANVNPLAVIGAVILLLAVTLYAWQQRKSRKYLLMGWLWFLGTLVPVIGIVQVGLQSLADRYTYIPYFGLFIMLVWGARDLFEHFKLNKKIVAAICVVALLVFTGLAFWQTSLWRTSETLYTHTIAVTEKNYFLMTNLCLHHLYKSTPETAEKRCSELLEATPPTPESNNLLGYLRTVNGKYEQAVANYEAAIRMRPNWAILYANLSETQSKQGKPEEAEKNLQKAFSIKDASVNNDVLSRSCNILGESFLQKNRREKAVEYFSKALEIKPDFNEARENLLKAKGEK